MKRRLFILSAISAAASTSIPSHLLAAQPSGLGQGQILGLTLANGSNGNDLDILPGACRDQDNTCDITISERRTNSAPLKDGTWHIYAIAGFGRRDDIMYSQQARSPDMPKGYSRYRRIASIPMRSGSFVKFHQSGEMFNIAH